MLTEFISLIRAEINRAIYVWGGNGEIVTSELQILNAETSAANAGRAIKLYRVRLAAKISPIRKVDCSGLVVYALRVLGIFTPDKDMTANGFSNLCATISKADLRVGDLVFDLDSSGNAFHMGIVSRIESGITYITESRGRDYGVVERPISAGYWDDFGHNPFIDTNIQEVDMLQKGDKSASVKSWQEALNKLGAKLAADGVFGPATETATKDFQSHNGLPATGIVDTATAAKAWDALGVILSDTAELNTVKAQLFAKTEQFTSLTADVRRAAAAQLAAEQFAALKETESRVALADLAKIASGLRIAAKY